VRQRSRGGWPNGLTVHVLRVEKGQGVGEVSGGAARWVQLGIVHTWTRDGRSLTLVGVQGRGVRGERMVREWA